MKEITVHPSHFEDSWHNAGAGTIFHVLLHGTEWSPELRRYPPRIRLLERGHKGVPSRCEILDEWPGAPDFWPPERAPKTPARKG